MSKEKYADNSTLVRIIIQSLKNSPLVPSLKEHADTFYEVCLSYDKKISPEAFFSYLHFVKEVLFPNILPMSASHLHQLINFHCNDFWDGESPDKRDLREVTEDPMELITEYIGLCLNLSSKKIISYLSGGNETIYNGYEGVLLGFIRSAVNRCKEEILKNYEEYLSTERESLVAYI